jgi:phosphotransferase system  glucose/maltose/N-acetylglucosamine-specific IIC component
MAAPEFPGFAPSSPPTPPQAAHQPIADRAFIGTLAAIGSVLASRLILLLAVIGAFVLAMKADGTAGLWILVAYACLTVLPLTVLDVITRQRGGL